MHVLLVIHIESKCLILKRHHRSSRESRVQSHRRISHSHLERKTVPRRSVLHILYTRYLIARLLKIIETKNYDVLIKFCISTYVPEVNDVNSRRSLCFGNGLVVLRLCKLYDVNFNAVLALLTTCPDKLFTRNMNIYIFYFNIQVK